MGLASPQCGQKRCRMNDLLTAMAIITPVTTGLIEMVKRVNIPTRIVPIMPLVLGIAAAFLFPPSMGATNEIAAGVLSGLAASGLYSGVVKTTAMGK